MCEGGCRVRGCLFGDLGTYIQLSQGYIFLFGRKAVFWDLIILESAVSYLMLHFMLTILSRSNTSRKSA
jgi:hypothetical protein